MSAGQPRLDRRLSSRSWSRSTVASEMTDELITLNVAANELGLRDSRTVASLLRRHGIPTVRLGRQRRVRRSDLQRLITASLEFGGDMPRSEDSRQRDRKKSKK